MPRSINRMQQLNAVKISGVTLRPLDETLRYLETEAKILPSSYTVDYTGESRQLKREGNTFLPAFLMALTMIFLVLAAQYNSFRDPIVILAGSVPLAMFGGAGIHFPENSGADAALHGRLYQHAEYLFAGGSGDAGWSDCPQWYFGGGICQ